MFLRDEVHMEVWDANPTATKRSDIGNDRKEDYANNQGTLGTNQRAHPYRMDRPRPTDPRRLPPPNNPEFNTIRGCDRPHQPVHRPTCSRHYEERWRDEDRKRWGSTPPRLEAGSAATRPDKPPWQVHELMQLQEFVNTVMARQMQNYIQKLYSIQKFKNILSFSLVCFCFTSSLFFVLCNKFM